MRKTRCTVFVVNSDKGTFSPYQHTLLDHSLHASDKLTADQPLLYSFNSAIVNTYSLFDLATASHVTILQPYSICVWVYLSILLNELNVVIDY